MDTRKRSRENRTRNRSLCAAEVNESMEGFALDRRHVARPHPPRALPVACGALLGRPAAHESSRERSTSKRPSFPSVQSVSILAAIPSSAPAVNAVRVTTPAAAPFKSRGDRATREAEKTPVSGGFIQADGGTRTHDLLHGNPTRAATRCNAVQLKCAFSRENA